MRFCCHPREVLDLGPGGEEDLPPPKFLLDCIREKLFRAGPDVGRLETAAAVKGRSTRLGEQGPNGAQLNVVAGIGAVGLCELLLFEHRLGSDVQLPGVMIHGSRAASSARAQRRGRRGVGTRRLEASHGRELCKFLGQRAGPKQIGIASRTFGFDIRFEANLRSNSRVAGLILAIFGSSHSGLRRARRSEGKLAGPIRFASIIDLTRPGLGPMTSGLKGSAAHQLGASSPPRHGGSAFRPAGLRPAGAPKSPSIPAKIRPGNPSRGWPAQPRSERHNCQ